MEKKYTLGFVFNRTMHKVLLVHKQRPDWQKGKLNGIGGKIEKGEDSRACIVRETQEESGLLTREKDWIFLGEIRQPQGTVDVYAFLYSGEPDTIVTTTDEEVEWMEILPLPNMVISNLHWLIPFALDKLQGKNGLQTFIAEYSTGTSLQNS